MVQLRMVYKRHMNLKEMLLADLHSKVMHGVFDTITAPKNCNCRTYQQQSEWSMHRSVRCECQTGNLIYKATVMVDRKHYLDKTHNDLKPQIFKHITDVGKFPLKQKRLN